MRAGKFLIDLTDARFSIPENEDVLEFIRRVNPFAHSDVGTVLFELGKEIGASALRSGRLEAASTCFLFEALGS